MVHAAQSDRTCRQIPNGIHGIEERLHVTWHTLVNTGLITPPDFVRLTSTAAAKIFNIFPRKGAVVPGADADLIIFDAAKEHTLGAAGHFSALDTSVYEGMRIQGQVSLAGFLVFHTLLSDLAHKAFFRTGGKETFKLNVRLRDSKCALDSHQSTC